MKQDIINLENENVGSIELVDRIFGLDVRADILHRVVNWQLAKRRAGTHKAKDRSEVHGTGRKPFAQKGGGRARAGSKKVSQMRGGGVAFGPVVRDHSHKLTKKFRKLGLRTALSAKLKDGKLIVLDDAKVDSPKSKELFSRVGKLGWKSALVIGGKDLDKNFTLAARNLKGIDVLPQQGVNVYDILRRDTLVLTKEAVEHLE
ncbi:MAG: 50S ribosomal protein L4, partial [Alphaproteobacteria bacterium]|nr:50S ribosomal protein L4 [Alphaproteobacteria bacterium]